MDNCPVCKYHRQRAQNWREEAYRLAGHPLPHSADVGDLVYIHDSFGPLPKDVGGCMTEEYRLFPTLVTKTSNVLNAQQRADIFAYVRGLHMTEHGALQGTAKSTHATNKIYLLNDIAEDIESCRGIREDITKLVEEYAGLSKFKVKALDNSWTNTQEEGSVLVQHTHPLSVVSGALYIHVDEESSKLCFDNPNPYIKFTTASDNGEFTHGSFWFAPDAGDLILFPSWLSHGSGNTTNNTKERTVISFNTI
jgi:uncharacterized protein (TIGR02466 family)